MNRYFMDIPITNEGAEVRFVIDGPMRRTLTIVGERDEVERKLLTLLKTTEQALRKMNAGSLPDDDS